METETQSLKLTSDQKQKMRGLMAMMHQRREEKRRYNYMRPGSTNYAKAIERSQRRAQQRLEGVVMGLMDRYATEQDIAFEEIQQKIAEDPTLLENFYQEALDIIPKHYLPIILTNRESRFSYYPYRQGGSKGVPYRKGA